MTTRAAAASSSKQAKQQLVRLLFHEKYARKSPAAHRFLDAARYDFAELRQAYLERIQELHPDKTRHCTDEKSKFATDEKFRELREAWVVYSQFAKTMNRVEGGDGAEASFTLFGVGCSFSDSAEEQRMRAEFTDQCCKGFIPHAQLATESHKGQNERQSASLIDDSMFSDIYECDETETEVSTSEGRPKPTRSLVRHLLPPQQTH